MPRLSVPLVAALLSFAFAAPHASAGYDGPPPLATYYVPLYLGAYGWNEPLLTVAVYNRPEPPAYGYRPLHRHGYWRHHRGHRHVVSVARRGCVCRPPGHPRHSY
jgi:hypothetical protein